MLTQMQQFMDEQEKPFSLNDGHVVHFTPEWDDEGVPHYDTNRFECVINCPKCQEARNAHAQSVDPAHAVAVTIAAMIGGTVTEGVEWHVAAERPFWEVSKGVKSIEIDQHGGYLHVTPSGCNEMRWHVSGMADLLLWSAGFFN